MKMKTPKNKYTNKIDTNRKPTRGFLPNDQQIEILEYIWQHGFLHVDQVRELLGLRGLSWSGELLSELFHNSYLHRPNPHVRKRYDFMFYWLSKKGARKVAEKHNTNLSGLDWQRRPLWSQIDHDATVTDLRIILEKACDREPDFTFQTWYNETTFRSWQDSVEYTNSKGNKRTKKIYLDAFALIVQENPEPNKNDFFSRLMIECEMSPKSNPRFGDDKLLPQLAYLRSDMYKKRTGSQTGSGRFLYIVPSEEKMNNFRRAVRSYINKIDWAVFYFTTYDQVSDETILFGDIWHKADLNEPPVSLFKRL